MKVKKEVLYSIGVSVLFHVIVFVFAAGIKVPGAYTMLYKSKRLFDVKILEREAPKEKPVRQRGVTYVQTMKFGSPQYSESIKAGMKEEKEEMRKAILDFQSEEMKKPLAVSEEKELAKLLEDKRQRLIKEGELRRTRRELVEVAGVSGEEGFVRPELLEETETPEDFLEKMPGFTPAKTGGLLDSAKQELAARFAKGYAPAVQRKTDFADLREYLVCQLSTYRDPADGEKYYRISIRAGKDAASLASMPKEIVFLVDCSLSIQRERLEEFKQGLQYCLTHLNAEDYFNVMAFKERIIWLSPASLRPTEENIKNALGFVDGLVAGEGTDAYKALYESMKVKERAKPSYVVIFSDGRPTFGMTDSRRIINEISKLNNGERPIFAFSGGLRVNRYFLDFISYKNRGWTEYAGRSYQIARHIANMYEKIKDPMFLNLRYNISGLNEKEVFPKTLPDFYRNAEFTLYGKYTDENEFSMQLLGDLEDETNEFIVIGSLQEASIGEEDIARSWAFNKIYYLIGLLDHGKKNEEILKEINYYCKKFNIKTPYSEELEK